MPLTFLHTLRICWHKYLFIFYTFLLPYTGLGQYSISGRVLNGQDQTALEGSNVFLAQTTKGTVTNMEGQFTISNLAATKYQLVVSHIGFKTLVTTIQLPADKPFRIILQPDVSLLNAITVRARRKRQDTKWANHLELFIKNFIGQTKNAKMCRLTNPNALYFDDKEDGFAARATEPLQVINEGLGYQITFQLDSFSLDNSTHNVYFKGYSVFDTLSAKDHQQAEFWSTQRRIAYQGSLMHFMRALHTKKVFKEGFAVRDVREKQYPTGGKWLLAMANDSTIMDKSLLSGKFKAYPTIKYSRMVDTVRSTQSHTVLTWPDLLEVSYIREAETYDYYQLRDRSRYGFQKKPQTSWLHLNHPTVLTQADGQFFEPDGLRIKGYWTWELIADDLPFDYVLDHQSK